MGFATGIGTGALRAVDGTLEQKEQLKQGAGNLKKGLGRVGRGVKGAAKGLGRAGLGAVKGVADIVATPFTEAYKGGLSVSGALGSQARQNQEGASA